MHMHTQALNREHKMRFCSWTVWLHSQSERNIIQIQHHCGAQFKAKYSLEQWHDWRCMPYKVCHLATAFKDARVLLARPHPIECVNKILSAFIRSPPFPWKKNTAPDLSDWAHTEILPSCFRKPCQGIETIRTLRLASYIYNRILSFACSAGLQLIGYHIFITMTHENIINIHVLYCMCMIVLYSVYDRILTMSLLIQNF